MDVDFTELNTLAADLETAPEKFGPYAAKAVEVSARKVKDSARKKVRARRYFKGAAPAIDYELKGFQGLGAMVLDAEIGYDKGSARGKLGNLLEFGAPRAKAMMHVKSAGGFKTVPIPGRGARPLAPGGELQKALQEVREDFVQGLNKAVADSLRASSL